METRTIRAWARGVARRGGGYRGSPGAPLEGRLCSGLVWRTGAVALGSLLVAGCGALLGRSGDRVGGESHFLRSCSTECAEGLECLGGVCTVPCNPGADSCSGLAEEASCRMSSSMALFACDVSCTASPDCTSLGPSFVCTSGLCRDGNVFSEDPGEIPAGQTAAAFPAACPDGVAPGKPGYYSGNAGTLTWGGVRTQAELDELSGCERVAGDLWIDASAGTTLDLRPLSALREVEGRLTIGCVGDLSSCEAYERAIGLEGLEGLERAGALRLGHLSVTSLVPLRSLVELVPTTREARQLALAIESCAGLRDLAGLERLSGFESIRVRANARLESLQGLTTPAFLRGLDIGDNPSLQGIGALSSLTDVNSLSISGSPLLSDFEWLRSLQVDTLALSGLPALTDAAALGGPKTLRSLRLVDTGLESLAGFELVQVSSVDLVNNARLRNVGPLGPALTEGATLRVFDNPLLESLPEFPNVTRWAALDIRGNDRLSRVPALLEAGRAREVSVIDNPQLTALSLPNLAEVNSLIVRDNALLTQVLLPSLTRASVLEVTCNPSLPEGTLVPLSTVVVEGGATLIGNMDSPGECFPL